MHGIQVISKMQNTISLLKHKVYETLRHWKTLHYLREPSMRTESFATKCTAASPGCAVTTCRLPQRALSANTGLHLSHGRHSAQPENFRQMDGRWKLTESWWLASLDSGMYVTNYLLLHIMFLQFVIIQNAY